MDIQTVNKEQCLNRLELYSNSIRQIQKESEENDDAGNDI